MYALVYVFLHRQGTAKYPGGRHAQGAVFAGTAVRRTEMLVINRNYFGSFCYCEPSSVVFVTDKPGFGGRAGLGASDKTDAPDQI